MAAVFDAASSLNSASLISSYSWSHTCSASANRLLLICAWGYADTGSASVTATVNANAATFITKVQGNASGNSSREIYIFKYLAPPSGASTIAVQFSAGFGTVCGAMSFTGVDQTTPLGTAGTASGSAAAASTTLTETANDISASFLAVRTTSAITFGASQTLRINDVSTAATNAPARATTQPGASSVTDSWAWTGADNYAEWSAPVLAVGSAAAHSLIHADRIRRNSLLRR